MTIRDGIGYGSDMLASMLNYPYLGQGRMDIVSKQVGQIELDKIYRLDKLGQAAIKMDPFFFACKFIICS